MGVGNLPAIATSVIAECSVGYLPTLGQTGSQETGNLLDESIGSHEGIVLAGQLLDQLLVLVQLLQVIRGHGVDAVMLSTVNVMLVTKNTVVQRRQHLSPDRSYVLFPNAISLSAPLRMRGL